MDTKLMTDTKLSQQSLDRTTPLANVSASVAKTTDATDAESAAKVALSPSERLIALMAERGNPTTQQLMNYFLKGRDWGKASSLAASYGLSLDKMASKRDLSPLDDALKLSVSGKSKPKKTVNESDKKKKEPKKTEDGDGGFSPQEDKYDLYTGVIRNLGYELDESVGNVNIVGVRGWLNGKSVENEFDRYNDTILCVWQQRVGDKIFKFCEEFKASVDPGRFKKLHHKKGDAHLMNGQYGYKMGTHKGYDALNPTTASKVWRDGKNQTYSSNAYIQESQALGINIHAAGGGETVNGWSAGCQVIAAESGKAGGAQNAMFKKFRDDILKRFDSDQKFTYTLIDGTDIDKYQEKQKQ